MATRTEATALTITTADECQMASVEVLRIRAERKIAVEKVNRIKIPATQAWKAACELFNEVDGRYAEAEKYLDGGILSYRDRVRRLEADRLAAENRRRADEEARARREQQEEYERRQREAKAEADQKAAELARQDAAEAEARGATQEEVQQIIENPLPVTIRQVAPPPLAYVQAPPPSIEPLNMPNVAGLSFTTEWMHEVTNESLIPVTTEYYSLDLKKISARVRSLKQHANIPGVRVWPEERPRKRS